MQMRTKALAVLAAIIGGASLLKIAIPNQNSVGLPVRLAKTRPCKLIDEAFNLVIQVRRGRNLRLNSEDLRPEDLPRRLDEIFKTRVYRFVFVDGNPGLQYEDVAGIIDVAAKHVDHVVIATPSVLATWPSWKTGACIDANLPPDYVLHPPR